jgi:hypothetical protein
VSCVKGREKQSVGELYDLFEKVRMLFAVIHARSVCAQLAAELWPDLDAPGEDGEDADGTGEELDIEAQIAKEREAMKKPRREKRFGASAVRLRVPRAHRCRSELPDQHTLRCVTSWLLAGSC